MKQRRLHFLDGSIRRRMILFVLLAVAVDNRR